MEFVLARNEPYEKNSVGFGTAGPIKPVTLRAKTPEIDISLIIENVKCLLKNAEDFHFRSIQYNVTDMFTAQKLKVSQESNTVRMEKNVLSSIGIAIDQDSEHVDLKLIVYDQFVKVTKKEICDTIFGKDTDCLKKKVIGCHRKK